MLARMTDTAPSVAERSTATLSPILGRYYQQTWVRGDGHRLYDSDGRAYYRRKRAEGKKPLEAIRCLKRRISDAIYRQLVTDAHAAAETDGDLASTVSAGPGGHCGASHESSAVDLPPPIDTSDQPLPGPATPTLQPTARPRKNTAPESLSRTG